MNIHESNKKSALTWPLVSGDAGVPCVNAGVDGNFLADLLTA
jgi:hypothetical protein